MAEEDGERRKSVCSKKVSPQSTKGGLKGTPKKEWNRRKSKKTKGGVGLSLTFHENETSHDMLYHTGQIEAKVERKEREKERRVQEKKNKRTHAHKERLWNN